jgi:hypothetical protein
MNLKKQLVLIFFSLSFLFWSCDHGQLGGADKTETYYATDAVFTERMNFLCGVWYSRDPEIGLIDGCRIRKWSDLNSSDKAKAQSLFPAMNIDSPKTYSGQAVPQDSDYVLLYDDTLYGQQNDDSGDTESWGFSFMGLVRAINIFNGDKNRGAIIIEYFEGADPLWLSDSGGYSYQGLGRGEKPFFGIYYKTLDPDTVQMANPINLAAMYAGELYYTEQETLNDAVGAFDAENEAEFVNWGMTIPKDRAK